MGKEDEQQGTFLLQLSCPCSQLALSALSNWQWLLCKGLRVEILLSRDIGVVARLLSGLQLGGW
eukprot:scaffold149332_cov17-Tisochrysis_lutea.AAC.1